MTELLLGTDLTETQRQYVESAHTSGKSLLGIINDILDFSKIEANRMKLEKVPFDLPLVVEGVLQIVSEQARGKQLGLASEIPTELCHQVIGDETRLRQVLPNLVSNAVKFTDQGEIRLSLSASHESVDEVMIQFEVQDSGSGISAEKLDGIF
jgi:signal transduction histidine kinase